MGIAMLLSVAQLTAPPTPAPLLPSATAVHGAIVKGDPQHPTHHHMAARGFSVTDGVTASVTFAVLAKTTDPITRSNRYTLVPNDSGLYPCAGSCYVVFAINNGLYARIVARGGAYTFQRLGRSVDLYAVGD